MVSINSCIFLSVKNRKYGRRTPQSNEAYFDLREL
jgi:hypothetical protein